MRFSSITIAATLLLTAASVTAEEVVLPHTFSNDTPALAGQVNDNFGALKNAISSNQARLSQLEIKTNEARTLTVKDAGDESANGAALITAMASISDATSENPWLIKLESATYDLGSNPLTLKPNVYIAGSGFSRIEGNPDSSSSGLIVFTGVSGLSKLWVRHNGGGETAIAIYVSGVTDFENRTAGLSDVIVVARDATTAIGIALRNSSQFYIDDSTVIAENASTAIGIDAKGDSNTLIENSVVNSAKATGGSYNYAVKLIGGSVALGLGNRFNGPNEGIGTGSSIGVVTSDGGSSLLCTSCTVVGQTKSLDVTNGGVAILSGGFVAGPNNCTSDSCLCAGIIGDYGIAPTSCSQ